MLTGSPEQAVETSLKDTFTHILVEDVLSAQKRLEGNDIGPHRRDLIRAIFSAIEGICWQTRQNILSATWLANVLSDQERAALSELSYAIRDNGNVVAQAKFVPILISIRLCIGITKKHSPLYKIDMRSGGWDSLVEAVKIRHRLVHPKLREDLAVTKAEITKAFSAFMVMALCLEIQSVLNLPPNEYVLRNRSP